MLWHLPLEPFESRYTADWYRWFEEEYKAHGIEYEYVNGQTITEGIETGRFLDVYGTSYWKMIQMAEVAKMFRAGLVKDGDVFLTCDLWHPGIELIGYMSQLSDIKVKVYGILHAGTYDPHDFLSQKGLMSWARWHEVGWISMCEKVFVSTNFHRRLIVDELMKIRTKEGKWLTEADFSKVVVTGLPFYPSELRLKYPPAIHRLKNVVFPSRLDKEKNVHSFRQAMDIVFRTIDVNVIETASVCKTKDDYYKTLSSAAVAVSTSWQETFGYAMLEAAALGCAVIVPDRLSYPEIYSRDNLYSGTPEGCAKKILQFLSSHRDGVVADNRFFGYEYAIDRMLEEMEL